MVAEQSAICFVQKKIIKEPNANPRNLGGSDVSRNGIRIVILMIPGRGEIVADCARCSLWESNTRFRYLSCQLCDGQETDIHRILNIATNIQMHF